MGLGADERRELTAALLAAGPDAPTLCAGWSARDLAAHVVVRDRRPDAALGLLVKPFAGHLGAVTGRYLAEDYTSLVGKVAAGAPFSPVRLRPLDDLMNGFEFAVHTEDVRRGAPGWEPRPVDPRRDALITRRLRLLRSLLLRKAPVAIALATPRGARVGPADAAVTVTGEPLELLLFCFGRQGAARVEYAGGAADVTAVRTASFEV